MGLVVKYTVIREKSGTHSCNGIINAEQRDITNGPVGAFVYV